MRGRAALSAMLLLGAGLAMATIAVAKDRTEQIAGWTLSDTGSKPGDDTDRTVSLSKSVPGIDLIYRPSESNSGASIQMKFTGCAGLNLSSGFGFDDPPADREKQVRGQVHEAFGDFAKSCPLKPDVEPNLMADFTQAFAAVDTLMATRPFTYPPEPADNGQNAGNSQ